ncbi:MAG: hypothetical protein ACOYIR_01550 [Christensenellales bacterium]
MDKKKKAYFRREFTKRTAAARWADRIFFTILAWVVCYGWFLTQLSNTLAAAILASASALTGVTAAALFRSIRFDRFVKQHTDALKKQALLEHLMVLPPNGVMDILLSADPSLSGIHGVAVCENGFVARLPNNRKRMCALLQKYPSEKVSASEILELHRRANAECCLELWIYSTAEYSAEAKAVAKNNEINAKLSSPEELIALADRLELLPDEHAVESAVDERIREKQRARERLRKNAFLPAATQRYILCAAGIMAASLITGYRIYYTLMAGLCLTFAAISWQNGRAKSREKPSADIR